MNRKHLVFVSVVAVAACGTVYADPIQISPSSVVAGAADAGSVLTAPSTPPFACTVTPDDNSPCLSAGAVCEVGISSDPDCNSTYKCIVDQVYGLYWAETKAPACSDNQCPAAIIDGAPCTVPGFDAGANPEEAEQICPSNGKVCACTTGPGGHLEHVRKWVCVPPMDGCPATRPNEGAPCLGDRACDYGNCQFKRGSTMMCDRGVWQTELVETASCP